MLYNVHSSLKVSQSIVDLVSSSNVKMFYSFPQIDFVDALILLMSRGPILALEDVNISFFLSFFLFLSVKTHIYSPTINSPFPPSFSCLKSLRAFTYDITLSSRLFFFIGSGHHAAF